MNPPPISLGIFTALLKENGFEADLFDTTLYPDMEKNCSDDAKEQNLQARPFDYGTRDIRLKESQMENDLARKLDEFRPDLVALSVLECTYSMALSAIRVLEDYKVPVLAGGVFCTFAPKILLSNRKIKMVCIGEGEEALIDVCSAMAAGADYRRIPNICYESDGKLVMNALRKPVDINLLPIPDYSLFERERFFRPMAGKIYLTIPIETNRGCPYSCAFCNSPSTARLYRKSTGSNFFRKKRMDTIQNELRNLIEKWNAEYIYFTSDTFLAISDSEFNEFIKIYSEFKLPFWIQSRTETITKDRMRKLKEVGCHRMSIGVEHGNNDFRKRVLKKKFTNKSVIRASKIIADAGIPLTVNNIIGFPDETRELIFDTIELNRELIFDTSNAFPFFPFHGSMLHQLCVERGYISADSFFGSLNVDVPLDMPQLSGEEISGLRRTFALYAKMPKEYWHKIKRAERFDEMGNRIYDELRKIYQEKYFA